jgi:hypothetical protein
MAGPQTGIASGHPGLDRQNQGYKIRMEIIHPIRILYLALKWLKRGVPVSQGHSPC